MSHLTKTLEEISGYTAYRLADIAGCPPPDARDSAGGQLLSSTRDSFVEAVRCVTDDLHPHYDLSNLVSEVAEGGPDTYTHTLWSQFVDLCAYQELGDADEGTDVVPGGDKDDLARNCLTVQLRRMLGVLAELVKDAVTKDDAESDDDADDDAEGSDEDGGE